MKSHPFPEYALRELWQRQQFSREHLATADGQPVELLSPGKPNDNAGPDFTDARVRIGNTTFVGDVELHINAADWQEHRHADDTRYNRVILHVVLNTDSFKPSARTASKRMLPLLVLHPFLDPVTLKALEAESSNTREHPHHIQSCRNGTDGAADLMLGQCLDRLAAERMAVKVWRFEERLKQLVEERANMVCEPYPRYYGRAEEIPVPERKYSPRDFTAQTLWDQLLYEWVMEALGYEKNRAPFLRLARTVTLDTLRAHGLEDMPTIMALLFGVAGLLPSSQRCTDKEARRYLRTLRSRWKELQRSYRGPHLHEADWIFFRLRPANFPTVRLASACFLLQQLFSSHGMLQIVSTFSQPTTPLRLQLLREICSCPADAFWSRHYHFHKRTAQRTTGLGQARIDQIILNVFIPITLLYARIFGDLELIDIVLGMLNALPAQQEDRITRTMQQRLAVDKVMVGSAKRQQGVLELYGKYCRRERCGECPVSR